MKVSVTSSQMKSIDQHTIETIGIPSMVLMERAALAVVEAVEGMAKATWIGTERATRVWVACGTGNNGADGIAVGRMLHEKEYEVTVLLGGDLAHATSSHERQRLIAERLGVPLVEFSDFIPGSCDIIVDAVLGVGLNRQVEGEYKALLELLSVQKTKHVIAVDIPSGIQADTGAVLGLGLEAEITVTFGWIKTGLTRYPGKTYAGTIVVADIGFSKSTLMQVGWDTLLLEREDLIRLPERCKDSNKGTYGKLLIIAGSKGMSGAAYLSAIGAYRTGTGLVKILTVEDNREILQSQLPEAIVETFEEDALEEDLKALLERLCQQATAIVLGPGIGKEPYVTTMVETVLAHAYVPIVLDADALNAVAQYPYLTGYYTENIMITPHVGEMSRLTGLEMGHIKEHAIAVAREYSNRYGIVCVLKDAVTVIADKDGDTYVNTSGDSSMAKAGTGDVLTGMIGALATQGMELKEAAAFGVYLHGLAGSMAAKKLGQPSVLAHEITDFIGQVWN